MRGWAAAWRGFGQALAARASVDPGLALLMVAPLLLGASPYDEPVAGDLSNPLRYFMVAVGIGILTISVSTASVVGLSLVVLYLPMMGAIRRAMIPFVGYNPNDPLTLVAAVAGGILFLRLLMNRSLVRDSRASRLMVPMMAVMVLQIFNPAQGGLLVGLAGAIFFLGPVFWFFIGRQYGSAACIRAVANVVIFVAICAAAYGLHQTYNGFTDVERYWMQWSGYRQTLKGGVRVFSIFLSFGEYMLFAEMGAVLCWVRVLQRKFFYLAPLSLLATAIFLSSSRGAVLMTIFGAVVLWAVSGKNWRSWLPRIAVAAALGIYGLTVGLNQAREVRFADQTAGFVEHQISGLSDPLSGAGSTGGKHLDLVALGFGSAIKRPLGMGLGITTHAARRFSEGEAISTEADVTNMFVSTGFLGGGLYVLVVISLWLALGRYWHETRDIVALEVVGLAAVTTGNWLIGAYYAPTVTIWICLGIIDRLEARRRATAPEAAPRRRLAWGRRTLVRQPAHPPASA